MIPALQQAMGYAQLPEAIKTTMSEREWLWLSDREKATLQQDETEPEAFDD